MIVVTFKINGNNKDSIEKLKPYLNRLEGIYWTLDQENSDSILTLESRTPISEKLIDRITEAGFESTDSQF